MPNVRKRKSFLESATQPEQPKRRRGVGKSDLLLCLCGCQTFVTERTQRTHLNQKGPLWTRFGSSSGSSSRAPSSAPNSDNDEDDQLQQACDKDEDDDILSNDNNNSAGDDIALLPDPEINLQSDADDTGLPYEGDLLPAPPTPDPIGDLGQAPELAGNAASDLIQAVWGLDKRGDINDQDVRFLRQQRAMEDTDIDIPIAGDGAGDAEEGGEGEGEVLEEEEGGEMMEGEGGEIYDLPEAWNPQAYKDTGVLSARDTLSGAFEFRRMELGMSFL